MNELKGAIMGTAFFLAVIFPGLLMVGLDSLHSHAFMKTTSEVSNLVKEEGGIGSRTSSIIQRLQDRGYAITLRDQDGNVVNGLVEYGDTVTIEYTYLYESVRNERELNTTNNVLVMKRNN